MKEKLELNSVWRIRKFKNSKKKLINNYYEEVFVLKNLCLNCGINLLWKIITGDKPAGDNYFTNANSFLGVGDDNTAALVTQTELIGVTKFKTMDVGYPIYGTDQKIIFKASFGVDDGNFNWKEFGVANYDMNVSGNTGTLFNRRVEDKGTKLQGEEWELQLTIS